MTLGRDLENRPRFKLWHPVRTPDEEARHVRVGSAPALCVDGRITPRDEVSCELAHRRWTLEAMPRTTGSEEEPSHTGDQPRMGFQPVLLLAPADDQLYQDEWARFKSGAG